MKNAAKPIIKHFRALLLLFPVFLICISCNRNSDSTTSIETVEQIDPLEGVWQLTNRYVLANKDTIYSSAMESDYGFQHKIYIDGHVMWTKDPDPDSAEWHGFGTYIESNDTIFEKYLSMSNLMRVAMGSNDEAILKVDYDESNFKQVMESEWNDTIYHQIEVYKKLDK